MSGRVLQTTGAPSIMVFMTDSADHVTGKTGLTLTIALSKNGGAFNSITPTVTERGNGWYSLALTASHCDTVGDFALHITAAGADPADILTFCAPNEFANCYWYGGYELQALVTSIAANAITPASIAADAIDAEALAADAIAEIQAGLAVPGNAMTLTVAYDAAKTAAQAGDSMALTSAAVDAVLDEVVEGSLTFRQMLRLFMAALANKSSGGGTTAIAFRDVADSKARISATVDSSGNRSAVTVDGS